MMGHLADLWSHVATKYDRSNIADKWQKQCFFFLILTLNYELMVEVAKILKLQ